jgi:hypothetical protein
MMFLLQTKLVCIRRDCFVVESIMAMNFAIYIYTHTLLSHERLQITNLKGLFYNWKHDAIDFALFFLIFF